MATNDAETASTQHTDADRLHFLASRLRAELASDRARAKRGGWDQQMPDVLAKSYANQEAMIAAVERAAFTVAVVDHAAHQGVPCAIDPEVPDDLPDRSDCLRAGKHVCGAQAQRTTAQIGDELSAVAAQIAELTERKKVLQNEWNEADRAETRRTIEEDVRNG